MSLQLKAITEILPQKESTTVNDEIVLL